MSKFICFFWLAGKRNKEKKVEGIDHDYSRKLETLNVNVEAPTNTCQVNDSSSTSFIMPENVVKDEAMEVAYEGEDENEDEDDIHIHSLDKHYVPFELSKPNPIAKNDDDDDDDDAELGHEIMESGHVSDPGTRKTELLASPKLKRSCSNLETRSILKTEQVSMLHTYSFEELQKLVDHGNDKIPPHHHHHHHGSPTSVRTRCSADKVMLKKHSSSQILPSGSRKIWWKLFLWSHRNMPVLWRNKTTHVPQNSNFNQQGGYSSDTMEPNRELKLDEVKSSGLWPQNQWVAFYAESPLSRVDEWVKELPIQPELLNIISHQPSSARTPPTPNQSVSEEILHANRVIQSLNSSSTAAHITGIGLKVIPNLSIFSGLQCVNLSNNSIVHVGLGSLPKGLHVLNLSRNEITSIEGFRELTRLRVLDLSYNRLTRIGHGLSNCTIIKELYLAGNKIGEIKGLHRLLKLTVLDLSFNKITSTKALGQLVANYQSLLALNILGNPVQITTSDDLLKKTVSSLLPNIAYFNKEPVNNHKAGKIIKDSIAKSALGNYSWNPRRKSAKRMNQRHQITSGSGHWQRKTTRTTTTTHHGFMLKMDSSAHASPSSH